MQRWRRLFGRLLLGHFALTVLTGLLWNRLFMAATHHRSPLMLDAAYASFWLFVPFCKPIFWPLSDWAVRSEHFALLNSSAFWQVIKYLVIAFLNSLSAVVILFGAVWLVQLARDHPRKSPAA